MPFRKFIIIIATVMILPVGASAANTFSASFNGSGGGAAKIDNDLGITDGPMTFEAWVKFQGFSVGTNTWLFGKGDSGTNVEYNTYFYYTSSNDISVFINRQLNNVGGCSINSPSWNPGTSNWHHIAYTYDGSTIKLYIDGVNTGTSMGCSGNGSGSTIDVFTLGQDPFLNPSYSFNGKMDDVRVWNTALSDSVIADHYNHPTELVGTEPGLVAYYKLNNNYTDSTSNAFNLSPIVPGNLFSSDTPPFSATLHVIKLVVNSNSGVSIPSNFNVNVKLAGTDVTGSPAAGTSTPGTLYTLSPGTYIISEAANALYTQSFVGDCNSSGSITLSIGDDKICTIVNTDIPPPPPLVTPPPPPPASSGGGNGFAALPLINITKIPSPLALPGGSGSVTYTYNVTNIGLVAMGGIWVKDNTCDPVTFVSGDTNNDLSLDASETWVYQCTQIVSKTVTNTATVHGSANGWDGYDTALATVVVGMPIPSLPNTGMLPPPLINLIKVPSRLTPFPFGGGDITYTYTVTNPGVIPMHDVVVTDDKCAPISPPLASGDTNDNKLLDTGEAWTYTCKTHVSASTRSNAMVAGKANGLIALDYSILDVLVAAPGLPNTGPLLSQPVQMITANMWKGSSGDNVATLQQFLISENKGPAAKTLTTVGITAYFGNLTKAALAEFQASVGISPALGYFGPITRGYINSHY